MNKLSSFTIRQSAVVDYFIPLDRRNKIITKGEIRQESAVRDEMKM